MHSNKTGNMSHRPILRYWQLKLAYGWKITHKSILRFLFFLHTLKCFFFFVLFFVFFSPPCSFWLIFKHYTTKLSAFCAACHIQKLYVRNRKLQRQISQNHTSREIAHGLMHTWLYFKKQEDYELDFGIKLKAESVLLTMTPKTIFFQNVTCSLFCGSASHLKFYRTRSTIYTGFILIANDGILLKI